MPERHPDDSAVRDHLAASLFNTLFHAKSEGNLALRDELRALARTYPDDAAVRELLMASQNS